MLQDKRRNRMVSLIIGGMGPSTGGDNPLAPEPSDDEGLELALGSFLSAIRMEDLPLAMRAFKAAFRALAEQEKDELDGGWRR